MAGPTARARCPRCGAAVPLLYLLDCDRGCFDCHTPPPPPPRIRFRPHPFEPDPPGFDLADFVRPPVMVHARPNPVPSRFRWR